MMRGSIRDPFFIAAFAFLFIIFSFIMYSIFQNIGNASYGAAVQAGFNTNETGIINSTMSIGTNFANTIPLVIVGTGIAGVIYAALVPVSPLFIIADIFLLCVGTIVFFNIQQAIPDILGNPFFTPIANTFPLSAAIANHIGYVFLFFGAIIIIVLYGKRNAPSGGGMPEG